MARPTAAAKSAPAGFIISAAPVKRTLEVVVGVAETTDGEAVLMVVGQALPPTWTWPSPIWQRMEVAETGLADVVGATLVTVVTGAGGTTE